MIAATGPNELRLQFVRGYGFFSWLISRMGFPIHGYSHVALVLDDGQLLDSRSDHVAGQPPGVRLRHNWYERWLYTTTLAVSVSPAQKEAALAWAMSQVGHGYDQRAILGFIFGIRDHRRGRYICSAFIDNVLRRAGLLLDMPLPASQVSPDLLYAVVRTSGARVVGATGPTAAQER